MEFSVWLLVVRGRLVLQREFDSLMRSGSIIICRSLGTRCVDLGLGVEKEDSPKSKVM